MSHPRRKRKRRSTASAPPTVRPPKAHGPRAKTAKTAKTLGLRAGTALGLVALCLSPLLAWSCSAGPGTGRAFSVELPRGAGASEVAKLLEARGALKSPRLFHAYLGLLVPGFELAPGEHLLNDAASPRELAQRLGRSTTRPSQRVTLPEGFQSLQVAERLERAEICTQRAFRDAVNDRGLLRQLGVAGPSAEGYLFPASYGLLVDSDAREVLRVLVAEAKSRLHRLFENHPGRLEQLAKDDALSELDVLTMASMIEKEARAPEERPLIASVFFNRLRDANFRPLRMLQSDPTAAYGCFVRGPEIASCADFRGSVTPALLRDASNPYNTYKHSGLPPGPIANPGEAAIEAVLAPARSDFFYFVAKGDGHHAFSRSFAEHRGAVEAPH